jgi:AraC-like DNA-binding protein
MLTIDEPALESWLQVCRDLGISLEGTENLMRRSGSGTVSLESFVALLEMTAGRLDGEPLGWIAGERFDYQQLGEVGRAILSSSTLNSALQRFASYFALVQDAAEFDIRIVEGTASVCYRILAPEIWPRQHDALFTLSILGQLLRRARGFNWSAVRITIEGEDAETAAQVRHRTGVPCASKGDINAIRFPASALDLPMATHGEVIPPDYQELNRSLARKRRAMSVELRVETEVYRLLGGDQPDQERIAASLGMSTRTLRRRLAEANHSFKDIVYSCRMRQAAHEFRCRRHGSIANTALRLGYSEHSALTRAFRRWSGVSPNAYLHHG